VPESPGSDIIAGIGLKGKDMGMGGGGHKICLDTETTGLFSASHHVIEVAAVVLGPDLQEVASFSTLANPGPEAMAQASPEALSVNGITAGRLLGAPSPAEAAEALRRFLASYPGTLHAFPVEFDRSFLACLPWGLQDGWGSCIQELSTKIMLSAGEPIEVRRGKLRASLKNAAKFFGVNQNGAHQALPDARAAAQILAAILSQREEEAITDELSLGEEG